MRKIFILLVSSLIIVIVCVYFLNMDEKEVTPETATVNVTSQKKINKEMKNKESEIRAVWFTYSEIGALVKGKSEGEYREELGIVFENLKANKINTVFYQCRAFCDSFYQSEVFPVSKYVVSQKGNLNFDPFEIFLEMGKSHDIKIHCWVNPYRVSYDREFKNLPENSPVRALYKENKNSLIICEKGIYLNPSQAESRKLVFDGIREILEKYKVDGIHFDDYFYPEAKELKDEKMYEVYKKKGGLLTLSQWRRENVNALVGGVYSLVKSYDENLIFSISPSADIEKCKNVFYADVEKWCREDGFADYIIPQIYFGFKNEEMPFTRVAEEWSQLTTKSDVKLLCGLAAYKCGRADEFAGNGKTEWQENVNILSQQYEQLGKSQAWQGFSLFSYSYCFGENMNEISNKEIKNLVDMLE